MKFVKFLFLILIASMAGQSFAQNSNKQPNILICIADDWSFPHAGTYGCNWVKTPAFDKISQSGILFSRCYTTNAKCSPSRASLLTGRFSWQLEESCNHWTRMPDKFDTYVETLSSYGYFTGYTGKGWAPGIIGIRNGKQRELTGKSYNQKSTTPPTTSISACDYAANFIEFIGDVPKDSPWCFWYGAQEPHRTYEYGSGVAKGGKQLSDIDKVPDFWPDIDTVRNDMLDYAYETEYFDKHLAKILNYLESIGQLENTLIVVTSDNGMPFPRVKGQEYEMSNHMPLAIMWPKGIKNPGRIVDDFISFTDFAPTFLEVAGIKWKSTTMASTEGKSLVPVFTSEKDGIVTNNRDFVVFGKERHDIGRPNDWGYPIRCIAKGEYLYVKNFEPSRWPAGNPETGYLNCDGGATKTVILNLFRNEGNKQYWQMNFGKRPMEELYQVKNDPFCMNNLAMLPEFNELKTSMLHLLLKTLEKHGDQRILGNSSYYESFPDMSGNQNFYTRYLKGEKMNTGWVNDSDFEKKLIEE